MPSCCSGIITHFDVLVIGGSTAGISAMLSAVSYGDMVALVEEQRINERLKRYFDEVSNQASGFGFDLHLYQEVLDDINIHLLEGPIVLSPHRHIQIGDLEYQRDRLILACGSDVVFNRIGATSLGLRTDERGLVCVDDAMHSSVSGVWAVGNIASPGGKLIQQEVSEGVIAGQTAVFS